jgi:ubiquinone/menaquinone biosynthesis C-methylase UbiE
VGFLARLHQTADRHNKDRILELVRPLADAKLVDLGCGRGDFTLELAQRVRASEVAGVDFVATLVGEAQARGVDALQHDLNTPLPFEDGTFDVVHSNQVIEHVTQTDLFLKEVRRILKPGGYAIVSTNNLSSWHNILMLAFGMQPLPCHISDEYAAGNPFDPYRNGERAQGASHYRVFSFRGFKELLQLHSLHVEELVTSGYYPFPPAIADRLCRLDRVHGAFLIARAHRG